MAKPKSDKPKKPSTRLSQADVPAHSLEDALRVPRAILEEYGGDPTKPFDVAAAMDLKPQSSQFKMLTGAALAYGLTEGARNASEISVTDSARQILQPTEDEADLRGKRQALLKPRVINEFLSKYNESPLPRDNIAHNVLRSMSVPESKLDTALSTILEGATSVGLIREIKGTRYVSLDSPGSPVAPGLETSTSQVEGDLGETDIQAGASDANNDTESGSTIRHNPSLGTTNRRVFITHGKNQSFIAPIKKLLQFGEFEAVVSVELQSISKPVPDKVMDDMRSCGAAIIHVEGEQRLLDAEANEHTVLNPNVLIEIGAAMGLYGKRFILLVREGVTLPSNLQGLYEVRYEGDALDGNATIKLLEAINAMKNET